MKGDFSRWTFDPEKHFSQVLMQQGRVRLDADWNEQGSIQLHVLRTLVQDIVGPHGGPADSFQVRSAGRSFQILPGHYYVGGILCELDRPVRYARQPNLPVVPDASSDGVYLAYLDVWERHISYLEDEQGDEPGIREVALGGADTATRAKVVWQVKTAVLSPRDMRELGIHRIQPSWDVEVDLDRFHGAWEGFAESRWQPANRGRLKAWAMMPEGTVSPSGAGYYGVDNRLYRVEIHGGVEAGEATFKWSRENGSVVFPILSIAGREVTLGHLGRDDRFDLKVKDWVEIIDDDLALQGLAEPLRQIVGIDRAESRVTLSAAPAAARDDRAKHPLLRRWDHGADDHTAPDGLHLDEPSGAVKIWVYDGSPEGNSTWHLEDGVHVEFCQPGEAVFRSGDYWLIPARTATGDVEWPGPARDPAPLAPRGVAHYYAPLAVLVTRERRVRVVADCRLTFEPLARPAPRREGG
jgi:hypothetical protein